MSDSPRGEDIVEQGGPGPARRLRLPGGWRLPGRLRPPGGWRPSRGAGVLAASTLVVGLVAGYAAGNHQARGGAARPEPTPTASRSATAAPTASRSAAAVPAASLAFIYPPFLQDPGGCSVQSGGHLELGVQFSNQSTVPLTLTSAKAVLPLGGLTPGAWNWTPCGALSETIDQAQDILPPGASTWLTMTFTVKAGVGCPAPLPVQFAVGYSVAGRSATERLPGFPDLGQVPYPGCPPVSPAP